jgi:hypothetical protein
VVVVNCQAPRWPHTPTPSRPRNEALEAEIIGMATRVIDRFDDAGLSAYADTRTLPGGIRTDQNWRDHARQELADCRNYLVWDTEDHWDAYQAGDGLAGARVAENLGALSQLVKLWAALPER